MAENKRTVAVFDFDGTLTTKDTLLEFIKFSCGTGKFYFVVKLAEFLINVGANL